MEEEGFQVPVSGEEEEEDEEQQQQHVPNDGEEEGEEGDPEEEGEEVDREEDEEDENGNGLLDDAEATDGQNAEELELENGAAEEGGGGEEAEEEEDSMADSDRPPREATPSVEYPPGEAHLLVGYLIIIIVIFIEFPCICRRPSKSIELEK